MKRDESQSAAKVPDLYALLNLEPKQSDEQLIKAALRAFAENVRKIEKQESARRAAQLFEIAKKNLLDVKRKAAYDTLWDKVYGVKAQQPSQPVISDPTVEGACSAQQRTWDRSDLDPLLPAGDPSQPFDLAVFLQSDLQTSALDVQTDFDRLLSMLTKNPSLTSENHPKSVQVDRAPAGPTSLLQTERQILPLPHRGQSRRRRRDRTYLALMGGVLITLVVTLVFLYMLLDRRATDPMSKVAEVSKPSPQVQLPAELQLPRRSGLPSVKGLDIAIETSDLATGSSPAPESSPPDVSRSNMPQQPEPLLTVEEKQQWTERLVLVRDQLGRYKFEESDALLADAASLAKTEQQKLQLSRIQTIGFQVKRFHQALISKVAVLEAGETFQAGSQQVSFVESSDRRLVVRIAGINKRYDLSELPPDLAYALVDLHLSKDNPETLAAKAAAAAVAQSNATMIEQARQWMRLAVDAGVVPPDTLTFFDDRFQLD